MLFLNPAMLAPGGVSGIATILFHTIGLDLGLTILVLAIPIFLIGAKLFGKQYGVKTLLGSILLSVFTMMWTSIFGENGILIDGAREFLDEVRERYHLEIITNGIARVQKARFKGTDTLHYFENIFISQEIGYAKPDPRFFSHVLSDLDTAPENCLVIGDSDSSDIKGAINSGIDSVFISFTGKTSSLADHSVSSYQELLSLLDDFN